jgi:hypothetical protein
MRVIEELNMVTEAMELSIRCKDSWFLKLFLFVLRLVVYSGSPFLAKVALSSYALIHSVTVIPRKRGGTVKSLLRYGLSVTQKKLSATNK